MALQDLAPGPQPGPQPGKNAFGRGFSGPTFGMESLLSKTDYDVGPSLGVG